MSSSKGRSFRKKNETSKTCAQLISEMNPQDSRPTDVQNLLDSQLGARSGPVKPDDRLEARSTPNGLILPRIAPTDTDSPSVMRSPSCREVSRQAPQSWEHSSDVNSASYNQVSRVESSTTLPVTSIYKPHDFPSSAGSSLTMPRTPPGKKAMPIPSRPANLDHWMIFDTYPESKAKVHKRNNAAAANNDARRKQKDTERIAKLEAQVQHA